MNPLPLIFAAVAAMAFAVGAASGAWVNGKRWSEKYATREAVLLAEQLTAVEAVRRSNREIKAAADAIRNAPVKRVRCEAGAGADGLPGGGADAGVGGGGPVQADRDYGPALRECLVLNAKVRRLYELGNDAKTNQVP